jgi:hypothetical protein
LNQAYIDKGVALGRQFFLYMPDPNRVGPYLQMELERLAELGLSRDQLLPIY